MFECDGRLLEDLIGKLLGQLAFDAVGSCFEFWLRLMRLRHDDDEFSLSISLIFFAQFAAIKLVLL